MEKCKLCLVNDADKTGSHLIPFFIQRTIDNEDNSKARDKEIGFIIGDIHTKSYFGRSILPNTLEALYGNLSEEEIEEKTKKPFVVDHLICKKCEDKLSKIENEYSLILNKNKDVSYGNTPFLFWSSILWRLSVAHSTNFKLKREHESKLQNFLFNNLYKEQTIITKEISKVTYRILKCNEYSKPLCNLINQNHFQPYCLLIGKFVLFYFFKDTYYKKNLPQFFDFEKRIKDTQISSLEKESILELTNSDFSHSMKLIENFKVKNKFKVFETFVNYVFIKHNIPNSNYFKTLIYNRMANSDEKIGYSMDLDHLKKTIFEVLQEHGILND